MAKPAREDAVTGRLEASSSLPSVGPLRRWLLCRESGDGEVVAAEKGRNVDDAGDFRQLRAERTGQ